MFKNIAMPLLLIVVIGGIGYYAFSNSNKSANENVARPQKVGSGNDYAYGTKIVTGNCTYTLGYWKTHTEAWNYTQLGAGYIEQVGGPSGVLGWQNFMTVFNSPSTGNAWTILAHQYFAAQLNIANGANSSTIIQTMISANSLLTANPSPVDPNSDVGKQMISLSSLLDAYNNGLTGPGHCGAEATTGGGVVIPS